MMVGFIVAMGMFSATTYIPLFVQIVLGKTATNSGLIMIPMVASTAIANITSGQIIFRTGKYKLLAIGGLTFLAIGTMLLSLMSLSTTYAELIRNMILIGIGIGITMPLFMVVVQNAFEHSRIGVVTASLQFFRNIGGLIGIAVFGTIMIVLLNAHLPNTGISKSLQDPEAIIGSGLSISSEEMIVLRSALAFSLGKIFLMSSVVTIFGLLLAFFLTELPLRKSHLPAVEETGIELVEDEGFFNPEDEPRK